jgi:hypothetical protein
LIWEKPLARGRGVNKIERPLAWGAFIVVKAPVAVPDAPVTAASSTSASSWNNGLLLVGLDEARKLVDLFGSSHTRKLIGKFTKSANERILALLGAHVPDDFL